LRAESSRFGKVVGYSYSMAFAVKRRTILQAAVALLAACAPPQSPRSYGHGSAVQALSDVARRADAAAKRTLVVFHASWCPYCRHLLRFLDDAQAKAVLSKHYEILVLNVDEGAKGDRSLELSDAASLRARLGGEGQGVPFFVIVDVDGAPLASSIGPQGNIGAPAAPEELAHFREMLTSTAPEMSDADLNLLFARLEATREG
jgi:thiol-disulfide isomerase/thioredoxin